MAVYVDEAIWPMAGRRWCHLLADDIEELHRFAAQLGVKRSSYQGPPRTTKPHYDITAFERDRALRLGAVACTREEIVAVLKRVRSKAGPASGA
ncbi:MAG TPA: DUF4031 domain-containing protein [Mesorhizobium sp.]